MIAATLAAAALASGGCGKKDEPAPQGKWDRPATSAGAAGSPAANKPAASGASTAASTAAAASSAAPSTPPPSAAGGQVDGQVFLPFFPDKGMDDTTDKIVKPTKAGMAEVTYKKGKDDVITIVVNDTQATPAIRDDYKSATDKLGAYPLKTSGYFKSAILVGDRFQVSATSQKLKADARKKWLEKMDLAGLAKAK
jgi:hypothetical protein